MVDKKMSKTKFNSDHKEVLDSILLNISVVDPGKMFGYPAYFVGGKLFACVYEDAVALKVPEDLANELLKREDIIHFQPLGRRKMKEWIQINKTNSNEYRKEKELFEASIEFVSSIAGLSLEKKKK